MFLEKENETPQRIDHMISQAVSICPSRIYIFPITTNTSSQEFNRRNGKIQELFPCKTPPSPRIDPSQQRKDFSAAQFIKFLKHIKLKKLIGRIKDKRIENKVKYSSEFILQWALGVYFFRCGSQNNFHTSLEKLQFKERRAILEYLGVSADENALPHRTIINDYFSKIAPDEINELLYELFCWAKKKKIFYNHMETLLPYNRFHIACDGFCVHSYKHPHLRDPGGKNPCPYCLPRTRNRGKEDESTHWIHGFVNIMIVFPGGLQLPLYVYALKAAQVPLAAITSDEKLKQECELQVAQETLPLLKKKLGRLPVTLLTDSLYANEPLIQLCKRLGWEYIIVRQEGSLKTLKKKCDELAESSFYLKNYRAQEFTSLKNGCTQERRTRWFNQVPLGKKAFVHVLRFEELTRDAKGDIVPGGYFKTEWLCSMRIHKGNCFALASRGRMRADHEDLHNTLKNRGFFAKHDYARANSNAWLVWKILMFVAFWIFELFSCTTLAQTSKGSSSWMAFARELFSELLKVPWECIALSPTWTKEKMQFRFNF